MSEVENSMDGKVALVTGATRGLGYEMACALASSGAEVIVLGRTVGALEELDDKLKSIGGKAVLVPLDLRDYQGIRRLSDTIRDRWGRLDCLVGNAGFLGMLTPLAQVSAKAWSNVWQVNLEANWHLISAMEDLLREGQGRALFVTSGVAKGGRAYWGPYAASKAALEAMVGSWAGEVEAFGIKANCLNPGAMATRMRQSAFPGEDQSKVTEPALVARVALSLLADDLTATGQTFSFHEGRLEAG